MNLREKPTKLSVYGWSFVLFFIVLTLVFFKIGILFEKTNNGTGPNEITVILFIVFVFGLICLYSGLFEDNKKFMARIMRPLYKYEYQVGVYPKSKSGNTSLRHCFYITISKEEYDNLWDKIEVQSLYSPTIAEYEEYKNKIQEAYEKNPEKLFKN